MAYHLKEGMYIYVTSNKYTTLSHYNFVDILEVLSNKMYTIDNQLITGYNDYSIGIILDKDNFIPISTSLVLNKYNNCMYSIPIYKRKNVLYPMNKLYFRIKKLNLDKNDFSIKPIKLLAKVNKIQYNINNKLGFIDLTIADSYYIDN